MSCRITSNGVFAENGEPSLLFKDLRKEVGEDSVAKNLYALSETNTFKSTVTRVMRRNLPNEFDTNGEIKANHVLEFANNQNKIIGALTPKERTEVQNLIVQNPNTDPLNLLIDLNRAFYDSNGFFNPTYSKLTKNGLYTPYEANNIINDIDLQERIKSTIERMGNTEMEDVSFEDIPLEYVSKRNEINSLGKLNINNPYIEQEKIIQEYGGKRDVDLDNIPNNQIQKYIENNREDFQQELSSYKRLSHLLKKIIL